MIHISLLAVMFAFNHLPDSGTADSEDAGAVAPGGDIVGPGDVGDDDRPKKDAIGDVGRFARVGELLRPVLLSHPPSQFDDMSPSSEPERVPTSVASILCHTAPAGVLLKGAMHDGTTRLNSNLCQVRSAGGIVDP